MVKNTTKQICEIETALRGKFLRGTRKSLFRIRFSHSDVPSAAVRGAEKALSRCRTAFSVGRKRPFEGAEEAFP